MTYLGRAALSHSVLLFISPESVLHDEGAESEETTDNQGDTDVCCVFLEHISETFDTVLGWRSIGDWLQEPE